jgi:rRNA processing protein Krr1/Pno1
MAQVVPEEPREFANPDDIKTQIREYVRLKNSIASMEARTKELHAKLMAELDQDGEEDDKGNIQLDLESEIEGVVRLEKQRRTKRTLDELKAEEIIEAAGIADDVYETKRVINEDYLMAAFYNEKITEAQLDEMFPVVVSWALRTVKK